MHMSNGQQVGIDGCGATVDAALEMDSEERKEARTNCE